MARAANGLVFGRAAKVERAGRYRCFQRSDFTEPLPPANDEIFFLNIVLFGTTRWHVK